MKYYGAAGLDMGGTKVENIADGTAATDAGSFGQSPKIREYGGATYDVVPDASVFLRATGDPAPTTASGDVVVTQT